MGVASAGDFGRQSLRVWPGVSERRVFILLAANAFATMKRMTVPKTLMERRKQAAVDDIANAALELFIREGFDATSIDAIAAAAGCSPRTFYRYFTDKEDVMFYDMPGVINQLRDDTARHLVDGLEPWEAVSAALAVISGAFDASEPEVLPKRMHLWLTEPALRARYMQYVNDCEHAVAETIHWHRGTTFADDDVPDLIAVAAIGAYRVVLAHAPTPPGPIPSKHLVDALATVGKGLADGRARSAPSRGPATRQARRRSAV